MSNIMKIVDELVREYFKCLKSSDLDLTANEISELFRYSICRLLDLKSNGHSRKVEELSKIVVNSLEDLIKKHNLRDKEENYRKGVLEACVHCMEMSKEMV